MPTLCGTKGSGSAAVEAAMRLAGQPYQLVDAASWLPTPGLEKLKAANRLVQVPTLVLDDGMALSCSCLKFQPPQHRNVKSRPYCRVPSAAAAIQMPSKARSVACRS